MRGQAEPLTLALDLELVGTERLSIVPPGRQMTDVKMTGSWPHPSFNGRFPPSSAPGARGFTAQWRPSSLAHHRAAGCTGHRQICAGSYDDVHQYAPQAPHRATAPTALAWPLWAPGELYTLADRATKYGLLFIALTFVAVGLF